MMVPKSEPAMGLRMLLQLSAAGGIREAGREERHVLAVAQAQ